MKTLPLLLFLCLCITNSKAQSIELFHPVTGATITTGDIPSLVGFRAIDLPELESDGNTANAPEWKYYWEFGDCTAPSSSANPIHAYPAKTENYTVRLVLTPIYSDHDDLDIVYFPQKDSSFTVNFPIQSEHENDSIGLDDSSIVKLNKVRAPKPGDEFTLIIPFRNPDSVLFEGGIEVLYTSTALEFLDSLQQFCAVDDQFYHDPALGELDFTLESLRADAEKLLQVHFQVDSSAEAGDSVEFIAVFYDDSNIVVDTDTLLLEVVNSHDPNQKLVDYDAANPGDTLLYTVEFENLGNAPANLVTVIDYIDTLLDLSQFEFLGNAFDLSPSAIIDSIPLDDQFDAGNLPDNNTSTLTIIKDYSLSKVAFVFQNIVLAPKESQRIYYNIPIKHNVGPGRQIGREADIYFDLNPAITTNAAITRIIPPMCQPNASGVNTRWIDQVQIGNIVYPSFNNLGYLDNRNIVINGTIGQQIQFTGTPAPIGSAMFFWKAWIDINRDGMFTSNEEVYSEYSTGISTGFINIPPGTPGGKATLRIAMNPNTPPQPCMNPQMGETEDYSIYIVDPTLSDLEASTKHISPLTVAPGDTLLIKTSTKNIGPVSSSQPVGVTYLLSKDPFLDNSDVQLYYIPGDTIIQSAYRIDSAHLVIPPTQPKGTYYVIASTDHGNTIVENIESNNTSFSQIRVDIPIPDLIITQVYACPEIITPGSSFAFSCWTKNRGKGSTPPGKNVEIGVYISFNDKLDTSDTYLGKVTLPAIASNTERFFENPSAFSIPGALSPNDYYLLFKADHNDSISERRENNNLYAIPIKTESSTYTDIPYSNDFECGSLGTNWSTSSIINQGVIEITSSASPYQGNHHLTANAADHNTHAINRIDFKVNLDSLNQVELTFQYKEWFDNSPPPNGLYFSNDAGGSFTKIWNLPGQGHANNFWEKISLHLDSLVNINQTPYTDSCIIRFQHYAADSLPFDGFAIDQFSISTDLGSGNKKPIDFYSNVSSFKGEFLQIYPNPAHSVVTIRYTIEKEQEDVNISLHDLQGRMVKKITPSKENEPGIHSKTLSLDSLSPGIYIVRFNSHNHSSSTKLVVSQ